MLKAAEEAVGKGLKTTVVTQLQREDLLQEGRNVHLQSNKTVRITSLEERSQDHVLREWLVLTRSIAWYRSAAGDQAPEGRKP